MATKADYRIAPPGGFPERLQVTGALARARIKIESVERFSMTIGIIGAATVGRILAREFISTSA
jgi:hypothetical protein